MLRVAFITSRALENLADDDRLALAPLAELDIEVTAVVWGSEAKSFLGLDLAVIRSPWDWYERGGEFSSWLGSLESSDIQLANRGCSRFLDKGYLRTLESNGARIVPTEWISKYDRPDLHARMKRRGWTHAVIKPSLSANAHRTHRVSLDRDDDVIAGEILQTSDLMVQPFFESVQSEGEWSFVFFGNEFSHALRKVPLRGDFRVQADWGGGVVPENKPPNALVEQATQALASTRGQWLYARVDGVVRDGLLYLMELELVEPELFLRTQPDAPRKFARAIAKLIQGRGA